MLAYRHAFHAGNHADALKHVLLLALCDALTVKPGPLFALDTHAGAGVYALGDDAAQRTGEAEGGLLRLLAAPPPDPAVARYLDTVRACRAACGEDACPGSPWLLEHALRAQDRIACCELREDDAALLKRALGGDTRVGVHVRDGYAAMRALLPPKVDGQKFGRGLVLIDPPYEAQLAEFDVALAAIRDALARWPQVVIALWYPIKVGAALQPFRRAVAALDTKSALLCELCVRPDDSPLRMNGSGLVVLNAPWKFDATARAACDALRDVLGEAGATARTEWLRAPA